MIEGTWEEIERHKAELIGRHLRVTVKPERSPLRKPSKLAQKAQAVAPPRRVSAMGKYAGILSTEDFMRQKQEEIELEDRTRS